MHHNFTDFSYNYSTASLTFARYYNSRATYIGPLGTGWSHSFDYALDASTNKVSVRRADGKYIYFMRQADGSTYNPMFWTKSTLANSTELTGGHKWINEDGTVYEFGADGKLVYIIISSNVRLTLEYDAGGNLVKVKEPFSHSIQFAYEAGKVTVTDPAGNQYIYTINNGDLASVESPDGLESYSYSSHNLIAAQKGTDAPYMQWGYNAEDKCIMSSGSGEEEKIDLLYSAGQTTVTKYKDGVPSTTTYNYSKNENIGMVSSIEGSGCNQCSSSGGSYTYDPSDPNRMSSHTNRQGLKTIYGDFDAKGNPKVITEAAGTKAQKTTRYIYHPTTGAPTSITRRSTLAFGGYSTFKRQFTYDSSNRLTKTYIKGNTKVFNNTTGSVPKFFSYSTAMTYTAKGQVKTSIDALRRKTTFTYYSTTPGNPNHGQLKMSVFKSYSTTFGNYSSGNAGWRKDAAGSLSYSVYDKRGRLIAVTAHTRTTRYGYDAFGNMTSTLLPSGKRIGYGYDANSRLTSIRDNKGSVVTYGYDSDGNKISEKVQGYGGSSDILRDLKYAYDEYNHLEKISKPDDSVVYKQFGYTNDRLTNETDHNSRATSYGYDDFGRQSLVTLPDPGDGSGQVSTAYDFDIADNTIKQKDGTGKLFQTVYDDLGHIVQTVDAEKQVTRYLYDAGGRLTGIKDPKGNITSFEYNDLDLVSKKTYADGKFETYAYYKDGLLKSKTNARNITATYSYDPTTRDLTGIAYNDSGATPAQGFIYYANGLLQTRTVGTRTWTYTSDECARVQTVDGPLVSDTITYTNDALDRVTKVEPQGGDAVDYLFDVLGRMQKIKADVREYNYSYGGTGNADMVPSKLTRPNGSYTDYAYDNLYRLTGITNKTSGGAVLTSNAYTYDKSHMRTSETMAGLPSMLSNKNSISYTNNTVNQLTQTQSGGASKTYAYDNDGNMTQFYTPENYQVAAVYDAENRLASAVYTDAQSVQHTTTLTYDPNGFVFSQTVDGTTTYFVRDGNLCLQERNTSNEITRSYVWDRTAPGGIGGLLELTIKDAQDVSQHYNYLYDGKGNVSAVTDSAQNFAAAYAYDGFGVLKAKTGTLDQPYMFSTKYYHAGFGGNDAGYRIYIALIGKWLTRDPLGEKGGLNLYRALENNGINKIDSLGERVQKVYRNLSKVLKQYPHEYIMFNRDINDSWGFYPSTNVYGSPGYVENPDTGADLNDMAFDITPPPCKEKEFEQNLKLVMMYSATQSLYYTFPGYTCVQWVEDMIRWAYAITTGTTTDPRFPPGIR